VLSGEGCPMYDGLAYDVTNAGAAKSHAAMGDSLASWLWRCALTQRWSGQPPRETRRLWLLQMLPAALHPLRRPLPTDASSASLSVSQR
jgi:hypothetical protein